MRVGGLKDNAFNIENVQVHLNEKLLLILIKELFLKNKSVCSFSLKSCTDHSIQNADICFNYRTLRSSKHINSHLNIYFSGQQEETAEPQHPVTF